MKLLLVIMLCAVYSGFAQNTNPPRQQRELTLTSKLHSTGHFPFTGSLLNNHLNADFNLYYRNGDYGFFVFKAVDVEDLQSDVNYFQAGLFRKISPSKQFTLKPYVGYLFLQSKSFADRGSDIFAALSNTFETVKWKFENTTLLQNILELNSSRTMTNRLEVKYGRTPINVSLFVWHNVTLAEERNESFSAGLAFQFPKVDLVEGVSFQTSLLLLAYVSTYKPDYAFRRGFVFSISFPIDVDK